ncbi:MAG: GNAT family N-acetyltransferase [Colwellia sp.]|nr:GNAT family N-acetyltransferase [Colwellia sp.]MCW8864050.1 GNAT family N-acetyltransferase [Colwellia sp.]MCW9083056.1 GNAT family N-acetyltransferase [Colwellia sp.]
MTLPNHFQLKLASPSVDEFLALRAKVGWQGVADNIARASLDNSLFHVVIYDDVKLVGMGRVIGDGIMYFYIQDVVVDPDYQGLGIGAALMEQVENYLSNTAKEGSTIGLLAAKGKEAFYARYGYIERPNTSLGNGMCKFI